MNAPFARHLTRFTVQGTVALPPTVVALQDLPSDPSLSTTIADQEAHLMEARLMEAAASARAIAETEAAAALARAQEVHAAAVAEAVAATEVRCARVAGEAIADQITAAVAAMRDEIAAQVATALSPLVEDAVVRRTVAAVAETVSRAAADPDHPALAVRGPASVLAAIEARLGEARGVNFAAGEGDILVTGQGIRIEARLAQALAAISDAGVAW